MLLIVGSPHLTRSASSGGDAGGSRRDELRLYIALACGASCVGRHSSFDSDFTKIHLLLVARYDSPPTTTAGDEVLIWH